MSTSQPIASTSSGVDAFDAIVQAANPSHPNHAAWVEKYGGSLSRKNTNKVMDEEGEDHLEKSSQSSQRRRRPSNGGFRNSVHSRSSPARERASSEVVGKYPSRESSIRTAHHSSSRPPIPTFAAAEGIAGASTSMILAEEPISRRKKKKGLDKGKGKGEAPPVPPPRTTSQALPSPSSPTVQSLYSGHASTSTLSNVQAPLSNKHTPLSMGSPLTPSISIPLTHTSSLHSRNNSISHQGMAPSLESSSSMRESKLRGRHSIRPGHETGSNEPPTRLSSMLGRVGSIDQGQPTQSTTDLSPSHSLDPSYRPDFSPTHSLNGHAISRRSSRKSVDFALPEEPQRRGSFDMYNIRKSFDTLVLPFREGKRATSISRNGLLPKTVDNGNFTAVPILKSPSQGLLQGRSFDGASGSFVGHVARPLSCVQDEGDIQEAISGPEIDVETTEPDQSQIQKDNLMDFESTRTSEVPTHPLAMISSPGIKSESMTEEGDDFFDAESDEGGNGSSADDQQTPKKATNSIHSQSGQNTPTTNRRRIGKRRSAEHPGMTSRLRAKAAASGLDVEGETPSSNVKYPTWSQEEVKADSSASEAEALDSQMTQKSKEISNGDYHAKSKSNRKSKSASTILDAVPQSASVAFPSKSVDHHTPVASSQPLQKQKAISLESKRIDELNRIPTRSVDQAVPDGIYHDDEVNRKYPFETSPSAFYFPTSISTRSTSSWNQMAKLSPKSTEQTSIISAPHSTSVAKEKTKDQNGFKTVGKGAFSGVMARMRRDRSSTTATSSPKVKSDISQRFFDGSPAMIESHHLESKEVINPSNPLGLGIATTAATSPVADIASQIPDKTPSKNWRTRLISFSQKSAKSPKANAEESSPPLPTQPIPPLHATSDIRSPTEVSAIEAQLSHKVEIPPRAIFDQDSSKNVSSSAPLHARNKETLFNNSIAKTKVDLQQSSPTIHKTLSPALLTQNKHEADEVASFVGSERDNDSKRETWSTINHLEIAPDQTVDDFYRDRIASPRSEEQSSLASPASLGARRLTEAVEMKSKSINGVANNEASKVLSPFPLPTSRRSPLPREHGNYNIRDRRPSQPSPAPRRSMDVRMYRSGPIPLDSNNSKGTTEAHSRGHSITLDRNDFYNTPQSPKVPFSTSSSISNLGTGTGKMSKRFFSGHNRAIKMKSKGISSDNFHLSEGNTNSSLEGLSRMPYSKSEICLINIGRNHKDKFHHRGQYTAEDLFADDTLVPPSNSHSQLDSGSINSNNNNNNNSNGYTPMTPKIRQVNEEEISAFDRMLRERAKDDAAQLRQITAQVRAQQSPN